MNTLFSARALMGISLGFHIIYATIGIGLPLHADDCRRAVASHRRRALPPACPPLDTSCGGAVRHRRGLRHHPLLRAGASLAPLHGIQRSPHRHSPFSMEGFAFFTEAIFLALYIYGEQRLSRRMLFFCTIPLTVAAAASAVFVISANAWMNTPAGFQPGEWQPLPMFTLSRRLPTLHGPMRLCTAPSRPMSRPVLPWPAYMRRPCCADASPTTTSAP